MVGSSSSSPLNSAGTCIRRPDLVIEIPGRPGWMLTSIFTLDRSNKYVKRQETLVLVRRFGKDDDYGSSELARWTVLPDPKNEPTLTVTRAAEVLGISRASAYTAVSRGEIPALRIGGRIVIPTAAACRDARTRS